MSTAARPTCLELAVNWERGWKVYEVTGTRHAHFLLKKLAARDGFLGARLRDLLYESDGTVTNNVLMFSSQDILYGSEKFGALLDRGNSNYDLEH